MTAHVFFFAFYPYIMNACNVVVVYQVFFNPKMVLV
jgi:hypothetical protein